MMIGQISRFIAGATTKSGEDTLNFRNAIAHKIFFGGDLAKTIGKANVAQRLLWWL